MPRITSEWNSKAPRQPSSDDDLRVLFSRMACACAETSAYADAPMARALFNHVKVMKQPPTLAASALGIASGDAVYLLNGLREDVAKDFVHVMLAGRSFAQTINQKEINDE